MFNQYVNLAEYLSSVKLIIGSILIFIALFTVNVGIIACLSYVYKPLPSHKQKYLFVCAAFTFALDVIFFVLSLYDKAFILLILLLILAFIVLEHLILAKFTEKNSALTKALVIQTVANSALYFIGSYYLSGFYILLFCMNRI